MKMIVIKIKAFIILIAWYTRLLREVCRYNEQSERGTTGRELLLWFSWEGMGKAE